MGAAGACACPGTNELNQGLTTLASRAQVLSRADKSIALKYDLAETRRRVANADLDVLLFLDLPLDSWTYMLAFARLAPMQVSPIAPILSPATKRPLERVVMCQIYMAIHMLCISS